MERLGSSRSPSPLTTAATWPRLETRSRSPRPDQPGLDSWAGSRESQVLCSPQNNRKHGQYSSVAASDASRLPVQYPEPKTEVATILTDCVVVFLPTVLIVFVVVLRYLKDSEIDKDSYASWDNAITVMATVLPILFAAVLGRFMSEVTRWRLESGASVGSLEQIMGSRTVGGAVATVFQFRFWNLLTLGLLFIWAFSPLGTQSLLRLSSLRPGRKSNWRSATYFDTSAVSLLVPWTTWTAGSDEAAILEGKFGRIGTLYTTLVSTPEASKLNTMDLWGNVKIPYLDSAGGRDWKDVPQDLSTDRYSSLAGVPLSHISPNRNTSFSLNSSYIQLQCSNISREDRLSDRVTDLLENEMLEHAFEDFASQYAAGFKPSIYKLPNGTWHGTPRSIDGTPTTWSIGLDRFVDPLWFGGNKTNHTNKHDDNFHRLGLFANEEGIEAGPTGLVFQATCLENPVVPSTFYTGYCTASQRYVESRVYCARVDNSPPTCAVTSQRPSRERHAPEAITLLSFPEIFRHMSQQLPMTTGGRVSYGIEPSLYYIADPSLASMAGGPRDFLGNVTTEDLGIRLGQLLNTYYQLTQMYHLITGGAGGEPTLDHNITTAAEVSSSVLLFGISNAWAGLCLASCTVMLAAGVLSVALVHRASSPEILGYVSTVFRDSRHMRLAEGSDRLTAVELSRSMAGERIRYGVLRGEDGEELIVGVGREEDVSAAMPFGMAKTT